MKFSIIVPVYNAAKTLQRCIDSVVRQRFSDYELILINDGSSDGSDAICIENSSRYPQVKYVAKENGGVSSARNLGLELAAGEYILFLDSDDFVSDDYFDVLQRAYSAHSPDLLLFGAKSFGGAQRTWQTGSYFEDTDEGIAARIYRAIKEYKFSAVTTKVFKKSIIRENGLSFDGKLDIGEDQTFLFEYAMHIKSVKSINDIIYNIDLTHDDSLSRKARDYLPEQLLAVDKKMYAAFIATAHSRKAAVYYERALSWAFYRSAYSCFNELMKFELSERQRLDDIGKICRAFNSEKVKPLGFKCRIIALPVKLKMCRCINFIITLKSQL